MPTYDPILPAEVGAGQPITSSLITRLRDNPLALISAVPHEITSSGTYQVPTGVTLLMVICVGGGGGGQTGSGSISVGGGTSGYVKCGFVTTTGSGSEQLPCVIGAGGLGGTAYNPGGNGGPTTFNNTITAGGGFGGGQPIGVQTGGAINLRGEQTMITGGTPGSGGTNGGGAAGVPWFLRTSSLGNGGDFNTSGGNGGDATGYGAGGGGAQYYNGIRYGGNGSGGIIFVLPLQA